MADEQSTTNGDHHYVNGETSALTVKDQSLDPQLDVRKGNTSYRESYSNTRTTRSKDCHLHKDYVNEC